MAKRQLPKPVVHAVMTLEAIEEAEPVTDALYEAKETLEDALDLLAEEYLLDDGFKAKMKTLLAEFTVTLDKQNEEEKELLEQIACKDFVFSALRARLRDMGGSLSGDDIESLCGVVKNLKNFELEQLDLDSDEIRTLAEGIGDVVVIPIKSLADKMKLEDFLSREMFPLGADQTEFTGLDLRV